jgi:hypothetical protein
MRAKELSYTDKYLLLYLKTAKETFSLFARIAPGWV